MGTVRVMVVSDSHLSESTPEATANWDAVVDHVARLEPDLVVHAGDVSADGSRRTDDLAYARAQLDRLDAPLAVIPGNHDVGDLPGPGSSPGPPVHAESIALFRAVFGADRFSVPVGRWQVVGIDAQACGAGGDVEASHWAWLDGALASLAPATPVVVVSHRPLISSKEAPWSDGASNNPNNAIGRCARAACRTARREILFTANSWPREVGPCVAETPADTRKAL